MIHKRKSVGQNFNLAHACGLYYKHVMIVNDASSGINKWSLELIDTARGVIYDRHMFIVQATDLKWNIDYFQLCRGGHFKRYGKLPGANL